MAFGPHDRLLVPVTLLAILSVVSFLLPPEVPEKMSLAITILLAFTVYLGTVDRILPETSDQISQIVIYVALLLLLSFLCVIGNAIVVVIYNRERTHQVHVAKPGHPSMSVAVVDTPGPPRDTWAHTGGEGDGHSKRDGSGSTKSAGRKLAAQRVNKLFLILNCLALVSIVTVYIISTVK
ncbi:Arsenical-resistance protein 3 [Bulinus truncatus]|nr:Arsenical-resistance protein 3 [Bulinus truncatus]